MNYTVKSWCPGDNCDPCYYRGAASFSTSSETFYDGSGRVSGMHVQYNFGKNFYPLAVPVFETVSKYINASGTVVLYPGIPSRQLTSNVNIGQSEQSFNPISYYITPSYLQLDLMGVTIYTSGLSMIRNFFGYAGPGPTQNPIFADGWQVENDPHDIITLAPNQLSTKPYRADDLTYSPVEIKDLQPNVLYNASISIIGNVSFSVGTLPDGTPDISVLLMEGFVFNGPQPDTSSEIIADLYIMNHGGCWDAQFTGSFNTLWYRGPNPFF